MSDTSSPFKGKDFRPGRYNPKRKKKLLKDDIKTFFLAQGETIPAAEQAARAYLESLPDVKGER